MVMTIPVPKQQKKPRLDYMRAKPPKGSIKFNPKDPRFRIYYIFHYPFINEAERRNMVEYLDELTNDGRAIAVGKCINNFTTHYNLILDGHNGLIETIYDYWTGKGIDPEIFLDPELLDLSNNQTKKNINPMYEVNLYEECLNEAIKLELKATHRSNGTIVNLNGTLQPDFTSDPNNPLGGVRIS